MAKVAPKAFNEATTCRSRRHRGNERPTVLRGLRICADCRDRLEHDLLGLPTWYEGSADSSDFRVQNDAVVTIRSDILGTLASWCGLVVEERGVAGPNELDIRQLATFLIIHFSWLTAHSAAPDLVDELAALTECAGGVVPRWTLPRG